MEAEQLLDRQALHVLGNLSKPDTRVKRHTYLVPSHVIATAVARTAVRLAKAKAEPTTRTAWPRTYSGVRLALLPVMKNSSAAGGRHGGLSRQPRSHRPARAAADRTRHRSRVPRCRGRRSRWRTRRDLTTATSQ